jgi:TolA-binding protein
MKRDPIQQLLQDADAATPPSRHVDAAAMADDVLRAHQRCRRRRNVGRAVVAMFIIGIAGIIMLANSRPAQPPRETALVPGANPQDLEQEIQATEARISRMLAAERQQQADARLAALARAPTPHDITERAASAVLTQADRLVKTAGLTAPAERAYTQVINHFPDTHSADLARQRIAEMRKGSES